MIVFVYLAQYTVSLASLASRQPSALLRSVNSANFLPHWSTWILQCSYLLFHVSVVGLLILTLPVSLKDNWHWGATPRVGSPVSGAYGGHLFLPGISEYCGLNSCWVYLAAIMKGQPWPQLNCMGLFTFPLLLLWCQVRAGSGKTRGLAGASGAVTRRLLKAAFRGHRITFELCYIPCALQVLCCYQ